LRDVSVRPQGIAKGSAFLQSPYAKEQDKCTVHYIRTCVLNEIVLGELNKLLTIVTTISVKTEKYGKKVA
jgi:hypothetical protein